MGSTERPYQGGKGPSIDDSIHLMIGKDFICSAVKPSLDMETLKITLRGLLNRQDSGGGAAHKIPSEVRGRANDRGCPRIQYVLNRHASANNKPSMRFCS